MIIDPSMIMEARMEILFVIALLDIPSDKPWTPGTR
jgi:hypothetical protein